jgi:hypothetical protein
MGLGLGAGAAVMTDYVRHLTLTTLTTLTQQLAATMATATAAPNASAGPPVPAGSFRVDLLEDLLRDGASVQTHTHALALLGAIASVYPDRVLNHAMAIFTFVGSKTVRQDDAYTFHVIEQVRLAPPIAIDSPPPIIGKVGPVTDQAAAGWQTMARVLPPLMAARTAGGTTDLLRGMRPHSSGRSTALLSGSRPMHSRSSAGPGVCRCAARHSASSSPAVRSCPHSLVLCACCEAVPVALTFFSLSLFTTLATTLGAATYLPLVCALVLARHPEVRCRAFAVQGGDPGKQADGIAIEHVRTAGTDYHPGCARRE